MYFEIWNIKQSLCDVESEMVVYQIFWILFIHKCIVNFALSPSLMLYANGAQDIIIPVLPFIKVDMFTELFSALSCYLLNSSLSS